MKFRYLLATSAAGVAAALASPAAAQSTGSIDFEEDVIVVSGSRASDVAGVEVPATPKAKQVITEELIRAQRPGQTINDIVNLVPGVNNQNNDPWGSGGSKFTIRGFSSDRISQTVDGVPLNDSGNYALYTNQQVDPEVLSSVNVNLGSTDVDSPTAAASGGTINIRTRAPSDEFGLTATMTVGDILTEGSEETDRSRLFMRGFVMVDTGDFTGMGTKAFVSASLTRYNNPFNDYGVNEKQQYNARIWQDLGDNGDFIAIAGHYNQNRNNFFGSVPLHNDPLRTVGGNSNQRFPFTRDERFYNIRNSAGLFDYPCQTEVPTAGTADIANSCGTQFDRRFNPSNTGNIRGTSRFTLSDALTLSVEPSYQYVKANGGGTVTGYEYARVVGGAPYYGFIGGRAYTGVDLNGDNDLLDTVTLLSPSQTRTHRFAVISNLAYEINADHRVRLAHTYEHADHRQTGEAGFIRSDGEPFDVFPVNDGIEDADGNVLQKRDRQSYAILNQISGQYVGGFGALTVDAGLRAPFFTRKLEQNCFTTSANGFVDCVYGADAAAYGAANPTFVAPQKRTLKYDKLLPSLGLTYDFASMAVFANYSKGLQVPGTDNLYNAFFFPINTPSANPVPETTDSFDLGLRFREGNLQAQVAGWYTQYTNRLASSFDEETQRTVYRNLGKVDKYGVDVSVAWQPVSSLTLYAFGSVLKSKIRDDVLGGVCSVSGTTVNNAIYGCTTANVGSEFYLPTGGKRESGAPTFSVGGRAQFEVGAFRFGLQAKHTGKRYLNDENRPVFASANLAVGTNPLVTYGATAPGYTLVDFDARWNFGETPWGRDVALQLNVTNLFDKLYVGAFDGNLASTITPNAQIGAPRAGSISLVMGF